MDIKKLERAIVDGLEDVKGQDILVFDTERLSPLFERVIIASGTSNRQTKALASSVRETVKKRGMQVMRTEGEDNGEWIIVDCGAAVVHLMQPAIRQYYHLEEIWGGKPVKLKLGNSGTKLVKASEPMDDEDDAPKAKKSSAKKADKAGKGDKADKADKKSDKKSAKLKSVDGEVIGAASKKAPSRATGTKSAAAKSATKTGATKAAPAKTAATKTAASGIDTALFCGHDVDTLSALSEDRLHGTFIPAHGERLVARKMWLRHTPPSGGAIRIDAGAAAALSRKGASLLPGGVVSVEGDFNRDAMVDVLPAKGHRRLARGLVQYQSTDLQRIAGRHSSEIESVLGFRNSESVIRREDMVLLSAAAAAATPELFMENC